MKRIKDLKIGVRLNLVLTMVFAVIFILMAIYTTNVQKKQILRDTDARMAEQVTDLSELINVQIKDNQQHVNNSMEIALLYLAGEGNISETKEKLKVGNLETFVWNLNGRNLNNSNFDVDNIGELSNCYVSVFQKTNAGYVRISTNVTDNNGNRALGTILEFNSAIVESIEKGQRYHGRAIVVGSWMLTNYSPLYVNNELKGIIGVAVNEKDFSSLKAYFNNKNYFESGYPFVVDIDGNFIIHPESEGGNINGELFFKQMDTQKAGVQKLRYEWGGEWKYQYYQYVKPIESFVSVSLYEEELFGIIRKVRNGIIFAISVGVLLFVIINSLIARMLSRAINQMVVHSKRLAGGDLSDLLHLNQQDEIGQMAEALNEMTCQLKDIFLGIQTASANVASASQQISSSSIQLSEGATEQASSTEEVTSSIEEMTANIEQNKENAQLAESIVFNASGIMKKVEFAGKRSLESIKAISSKITIINDIAFQTNILALNAAVEAARAGEHGKGFAVVAAEVRKLAERSKVAADEIVSLALQSVQNTEESDNLINTLLPEIDKTVKLVQEINAASLEQNSGANQISSAILQLNSITQQNASFSEELSSSSEELASEAGQLDEMLSFFKVGTEKSRKTVKTVISKKTEEVRKAKKQNSNGKSLTALQFKGNRDIDDSQFENF
ncbi:MAG: Cache 3/Cache 2 fusion domain-containing protein [Bacteroidales bacterium]|nr:Cache 3/Cache 2 fusion domain-containing protein [Bacteroidales bacterium]